VKQKGATLGKATLALYQEKQMKRMSDADDFWQGKRNVALYPDTANKSYAHF